MFRRAKMIGSAMSQLGNVVTALDLNKTGPNESISARMHRQGHRRREAAIDALFLLFGEKDHCRMAHLADIADAKALLNEVDLGL